jgi:hypothetical protein
MAFVIGQSVIFGRSHGEQTKGVIIKINAKSIKVAQTEDRGKHPKGTVWTVAPGLVRAADGSAPAASAPAPTLAPVKDSMNWNRHCVACGLKPENFGAIITLQGTPFRLTGLNPRCTKNDVEIERVRDGKRFKCSSLAVRRALGDAATPKPLMPPRVKRTEDQILFEVACCYNGLSPENLSADGEASLSYMRAERSRINRRLGELFQEIGRKVSEEEIDRWYMKRREGELNARQGVSMEFNLPNSGT